MRLRTSSNGTIRCSWFREARQSLTRWGNGPRDKHLARYPGFVLTFHNEDPDSTGVVRVYTATKGTNVVRFFKADGKWMETASGTLTDQSLLLATGVRVGMSQQAFLNTFFTAPLTLPARPISILALTYVVDGAIQYCHVSQGVIDKIQITSVFTIQ